MILTGPEYLSAADNPRHCRPIQKKNSEYLASILCVFIQMQQVNVLLRYRKQQSWHEIRDITGLLITI